MTPDSSIICYSCKNPLGLAAGNVGRSETCPSCGRDVRVCYNCKNYDPKSYNECREPVAERVVDKEKRNFCDYFSLVGGLGMQDGKDAKQKVMADLDALFKK